MDQLRARAFLDILLGIDSRPHPHDTAGLYAQDGSGGGPGQDAPVRTKVVVPVPMSPGFRFRLGRWRG